MNPQSAARRPASRGLVLALILAFASAAPAVFAGGFSHLPDLTDEQIDAVAKKVTAEVEKRTGGVLR